MELSIEDIGELLAAMSAYRSDYETGGDWSGHEDLVARLEQELERRVNDD